jgi:AcrR family transcriptional regulator
MTRNAPIATRNEIARAVRSALIEHGYAEIGTKDIAEASSKSEASLYYYYETKDELLAALIRRAPTWIDERIEEIDASDPDERLREICDLLLAPDEDDQLHGIQIAMLELMSHAPHNPTLQEPLEDYQNHIRDILAGEIREAINDGIYGQNIDPEATATFILMVLDGTIGSGTALEMQGFETAAQTRLEEHIDGLKP